MVENENLLPDKKPGDSLAASHVNTINAAIKQIPNVKLGNISGMRIGNQISITGTNSNSILLFRITQNLRGGIYKGHSLWYSKDSNQWKPTAAEIVADGFERKEWYLDANGTGVAFAIGEIVPVYYDAQRGMYLPITGSGNDSELFYVVLKDSLAPSGSANAYMMKYDNGTWVTDFTFMSSLYINSFDDKYLTNFKTDFTNPSPVFQLTDIGKKIDIVFGAGFLINIYEILGLRALEYSDLVISGTNNCISSAGFPFSDLEYLQEIEITSDNAGNGFTPGLYYITQIVDHYAYLDRAVGTVGSTGGIGALTPMANVGNSLGTLGSAPGTGVVGQVKVYERQGIYRSWGLDDIETPLLHLRIHPTNPLLISNDGNPFTAGYVDRLLTISSGIGFDASTYKIMYVYGYEDGEEALDGWALLDREAGWAGSSDGTGATTETQAAIGTAVTNSTSGVVELVTMHTIAKIAKATVAGNVLASDTEVDLIEFKSMDGGQAALVDSVLTNYTDISGVVGSKDGITSALIPFTNNDKDMILIVGSGQAMRAGNYKINAVVGNIAYLDSEYTDTAVVAGEEDFNVTATTKKPLTVPNLNFTLVDGEEVLLFWNEDGVYYRIFPLTAGSNDIKLARLDGPLLYGDTATATLYENMPLEASTTSVTVHDFLLSETTWLNTGQRVVIAKIYGYWFVIQASCVVG